MTSFPHPPSPPPLSVDEVLVVNESCCTLQLWYQAGDEGGEVTGVKEGEVTIQSLPLTRSLTCSEMRVSEESRAQFHQLEVKKGILCSSLRLSFHSLNVVDIPSSVKGKMKE